MKIDIITVLATSFFGITIFLCFLYKQRIVNRCLLPSSLLFWPLRLKTLVIHPTSAIAFQYYRKVLDGKTKLPKRVYEGESQNITITFQTRHVQISNEEAVGLKRQVLDKKSGLVVISELLPPEPQTGSLIELSERGSIPIIGPTLSESMLELELFAAGCKIAGDLRQRRSLKDSEMRFHWNLVFEKSGVSEIKIVMRLITEELFKGIDKEHQQELDFIEHRVRVLQFAGLTNRQLLAGAYISGAISLMLAIIKLAQALGYLNAPSGK